MGRLTYKKPSGRWGLREIPWEGLYEGKAITKTAWQAIYGALCKLKDYEETGLTPDAGTCNPTGFRQ